MRAYGVAQLSRYRCGELRLGGGCFLSRRSLVCEEDAIKQQRNTTDKQEERKQQKNGEIIVYGCKEADKKP